jgi:hypothetical protein
MHDADCDCDWVAMERLEKVDLRLRQGCSGVELQRQGIAGLQKPAPNPQLRACSSANGVAGGGGPQRGHIPGNTPNVNTRGAMDVPPWTKAPGMAQACSTAPVITPQ